MIRSIKMAVVVWSIHVAALAKADDPAPLSVVKIETTHQSVDTMAPWKKHSSTHSSGTGVIIDGNRILTNAHVVMNAVEISVQPRRSTEKSSATIDAIAPGIDLAVLKLEDESLFKTHGPRTGATPSLSATVNDLRSRVNGWYSSPECSRTESSRDMPAQA